MNRFYKILSVACVSAIFTSCAKEETPIIIVPPSDGSTLTLNGLIATESGASAGNSVFVDFSTDKQTSVDRNSWDLGFYSGADFKVILNNMAGGSVLQINKTDLTQVTAADFDANALLVGGANGTFTLFDDPTKANVLQATAITEVSATDANNKVYILNRAANSVSAPAEMYKIRITRNGTNGYRLQYAKVSESQIKTTTVTKDANFNFQFASLVNDRLTTVEPGKGEWDINWGFSIYYTAFGTTNVPYTFSDLVFINNLAGVSAAELIFTGTTANTSVSYADFKESNIAGVTFKTERDVIGSKWRNTTGTVGVRTDRYYVVKDGAGNIYKLKFVSFVSNDGGTRGKPVIEYKLVKSM
ncbi:MAG: hypothetical protein EOO89_24690 [Pedobacter sp.]|nr:MAG: hypothetical protein EOO89_24690 [Pedobacter sp.]